MPDSDRTFSPDDFGKAFQAFLDHMRQWIPDDESKDLVSTHVREFMGGDLRNTHVVNETYPDRDLPNVHLALERYLSQAGRTAALLLTYCKQLFSWGRSRIATSMWARALTCNAFNGACTWSKTRRAGW